MPKINLTKKLQQTLMTVEQIQAGIDKYTPWIQEMVDQGNDKMRAHYEAEVKMFEYMLKYASTKPLEERTTTELKKREASLDVLPICLGYYFGSMERNLISAELTARGKGPIFRKSLLEDGQTVEDVVKEMRRDEERDRKKVVVY